MHPDLAPYIEALDVDVCLDMPLPGDEPAILVTQGDGLVLILCRMGLTGPALWDAIGTQLGYVALGFAGNQRIINPNLAALEYDLARQWAGEVMIPESFKAMALRDRWSARHLARLCFVPEDLAQLRLKGWMMPRRRQQMAGRPGTR